MLPVLPLLLACQAPHEPALTTGRAHSITVEPNHLDALDRCSPPEPFEWPSDQVWLTGGQDSACTATISEHLGIAWDTVDEGSDAHDSLRVTVNSMYPVLGNPQGTVAELEQEVGTDGFVRAAPGETYAELAAELGTDELRFVIYDYVTSSITETVYDPDLVGSSTSATADLQTGTVGIQDALGRWMPKVLVHEATHLWRDEAHVACPEGTEDEWGTDYSGKRVCDEDWTGPWGHEAAYMWTSLQTDWGELSDLVHWDAGESLDQAERFIIEP